MTKTTLMSREAYERAAATNPDAPSYDQAKANVVKQCIGQAVRSLDQDDPPEITAGYLASAMNVLLDRVDGN